MTKWFAMVLAAAALAAPLRAETYNIDPAHSGITFKVRHLVTKVAGRFEKYSGSFDYVPGKPEAWKAQAKIDAASINTNVEPRDKHLRSADFFDVEKCPAIEFQTKEITNVQGDKAKLHGDLTMHCVTKPVTLDLEIGGVAKDPWGGTRAGATATTTINRKDFGLGWNKALEAGGFLVGDDVEITLDIEGTQAKKDAK